MSIIFRISLLISVIFCCLSCKELPISSISNQQIETKSAVIEIPSNYTIVATDDYYTKIKSGEDIITICENRTHSSATVCEIIILPTKETVNFEIVNTEIYTELPYNSNGFEITYQFNINPNKAEIAGFLLEKETPFCRLQVIGNNLSKAGELDLKWIADNIKSR